MNLHKINTIIADRTLLGKWSYHLYKRWKSREHHLTLGNDNQDKTFYIIGYEDKAGGLFWLINKVAMHIAYAIDKHYIPIVDYMNYNTQYTNPDELHKRNIWEEFFEQPAGYSLCDIQHSRHIIINRQEPAPHPKYLMGQEEFYDNPDRIKYFHDIFHQHIKYNVQTKKYLENLRRQLIPEGKKTVGVLCRGTDYVAIRPKGHPIQPSPDEVVKEVKKVMEMKHCDYVFLATEDEDIIEIFQNNFASQLLFIPQERLRGSKMSGEYYLAQEKEKNHFTKDRHKDALNYLAAIYILGHCNCFIGGRTGGTKGVLLTANDFEYCKIYNLGLYP